MFLCTDKYLSILQVLFILWGIIYSWLSIRMIAKKAVQNSSKSEFTLLSKKISVWCFDALVQQEMTNMS